VISGTRGLCCDTDPTTQVVNRTRGWPLPLPRWSRRRWWSVLVPGGSVGGSARAWWLQAAPTKTGWILYPDLCYLQVKTHVIHVPHQLLAHPLPNATGANSPVTPALLVPARLMTKKLMTKMTTHSTWSPRSLSLPSLPWLSNLNQGYPQTTLKSWNQTATTKLHGSKHPPLG